VSAPRFATTGPGPIAADGSPVDMYLLLPPGEEPDLVRKVVPVGGSVLELGCGVGRVTHALVEAGYRVTAVDDSPDMLAHVRDAETVLGSIERLDLGRAFDGVLLASHLVNTPDRGRRTAFLRTCRHHLAPEGAVLIQRMDPREENWSPGRPRSSRLGGLTIASRVLARHGAVIDAVAEYRVEGGPSWAQPYRALLLDDEAFREALGEAGLRLRRWLNRPRTWAVAEIGAG
jgi:SAM-dependent methyltransferase